MPIDSVLIIVSLLVLALSALRAASVFCSTVRHCERSAAIQSPALHSLDCFVAPLLEGNDSLKCQYALVEVPNSNQPFRMKQNRALALESRLSVPLTPIWMKSLFLLGFYSQLADKVFLSADSPLIE